MIANSNMWVRNISQKFTIWLSSSSIVHFSKSWCIFQLRYVSYPSDTKILVKVLYFMNALRNIPLKNYSTGMFSPKTTKTMVPPPLLWRPFVFAGSWQSIWPYDCRGSLANMHDHPWMASLLRSDNHGCCYKTIRAQRNIISKCILARMDGDEATVMLVQLPK